MMQAPELVLRTSITADSVKRQFGGVANIDYRAHPGDKKDEDPLVIFNGMKDKGVIPLTDINILKGSIYSFKNRKTITRWLRDVCMAFNLKSTTLGLAVQLTDAFLVGNLKKLKVDRCQLAAVTCLWIAAKFEEMDEDLPSLRKIVEVCDSAYNAKEVLDMEEQILSFYKWRLPHTTVVNHVYLQLHMLSNPKLVKTSPLKMTADVIQVFILILDQKGNQRWVTLNFPPQMLLKDAIPRLCEASQVAVSSSVDVFQLFGDNFLLAQRSNLESPLAKLPGDAHGTLRVFVSSARSQVTSIFAERGSFVILRNINSQFLDLCDTLTAETVVHVEFLQLSSYVTALSVLALALCLTGQKNLDEAKEAIQFISGALNISASQSLAAADLLNTKYPALVEATPGLPPTSEKIRQSLSICFARPLSS